MSPVVWPGGRAGRYRELGEVATCNPGGAGKWQPEYAQSFIGLASVTVVADEDDNGTGGWNVLGRD